MKLDKSDISKNEKRKSPTVTNQSDFMQKSYLRLERRNTRFKMETNINASEATGSPNEEKESKHLTEKFSVPMDSFLNE